MKNTFKWGWRLLSPGKNFLWYHQVYKFQSYPTAYYCRNCQGTDSLTGKAQEGLEKGNKLERKRFGGFCVSVLGFAFCCLCVFLFHSATASFLQPVQTSLHETPRLSQKNWMLVQRLPSVYCLRQETKKDRCPATEAQQEEFELAPIFQKLKLKQVSKQRQFSPSNSLNPQGSAGLKF